MLRKAGTFYFMDNLQIQHAIDQIEMHAANLKEVLLSTHLSSEQRGAYEDQISDLQNDVEAAENKISRLERLLEEAEETIKQLQKS